MTTGGPVSGVEPYAIVDVDAELEGKSAEREEPLGTKEKFWFRRGDGDRWLFKYRRANTGEDWAERISADLAARLGLRHAQVELATYRGERGAVVRDFTAGGTSPLVHGNELLYAADPTYPRADFFRVREHTVESIVRVLDDLWFDADLDAELGARLPAGVDDAVGIFTGYTLLDALIGNTDRHHENWGAVVLVRIGDERLAELAPTFDHASSLGRELSDDARNRKYRRPDASFDAEKYVAKARSAIYSAASGESPLRPIEAFRAFAELRPNAAAAWLDRLARLDASGLRAAVEAAPVQTMSASEKELAHGILAYARLQLLENRGA